VVDKTFLHGARGPEYERTGNGAALWYLYDGLGSVLGTVDGQGNVVNTRKYDVYGAVRGSTGGSGPKHKLVGSLGHPSEDETGLIYMRARYYDPETGRFIRQDISSPNIESPQSSNLFLYCENNPVNRIDRNGKDWNSKAVEAFVAFVVAVVVGLALLAVVGPLTPLALVFVFTAMVVSGTLAATAAGHFWFDDGPEGFVMGLIVSLAVVGIFMGIGPGRLTPARGFGRTAEQISDRIREVID
jgi:RHS repeat-associated protein